MNKAQKIFAALMPALALAGCMTVPAGGGEQVTRGETIGFSASACFGACPQYSVTVAPDGAAHFEPRRFTAQKTPKDFKIGRAHV